MLPSQQSPPLLPLPASGKAVTAVTGTEAAAAVSADEATTAARNATAVEAAAVTASEIAVEKNSVRRRCNLMQVLLMAR